MLGQKGGEAAARTGELAGAGRVATLHGAAAGGGEVSQTEVEAALVPGDERQHRLDRAGSVREVATLEQVLGFPRRGLNSGLRRRPLVAGPFALACLKIRHRAIIAHVDSERMGAQTRIAAGVSLAQEPASAAIEAAREAAHGLEGERPDLAFVFLSSPLLAGAREAAAAVFETLSPRHLVGCVAQGVVGRAREIEEGPGVAVWAARLPGATVEPFHLDAQDVERGAAALPSAGGASLVALLADPFSFPAPEFLARLNEMQPGLPVVGGLALGGRRPGEQAFLVDGEVFDEGAAGVVVSGARVRTVVSQGCAPVGRESVVTNAANDLVYELAGEPALERLRADLEALPEKEQRLALTGLLAGLVIDENKPSYGPGDFLMRGLLGADERSGVIKLGERVRVGQTLRFHVRDAETADRDLRERLGEALAGTRPAGALLFTCNGRGTTMFPHRNHDAEVVTEALGRDAVAGYFCGGEIGPIGGRVFLHGFTATMAVFFEDGA